MKDNFLVTVIVLGLAGFVCLALGYFMGRQLGYREGCADTIEMYEWFTSSDHDLNKAAKNQKILDMFSQKE